MTNFITSLSGRVVCFVLSVLLLSIFNSCGQKWEPPVDKSHPEQEDIYTDVIEMKRSEREAVFDSLLNIWLGFSSSEKALPDYESFNYMIKRTEYDSTGTHTAAVMPVEIFALFDYQTPKTHKLKLIEKYNGFLGAALNHFHDARFHELATRLNCIYDGKVITDTTYFHPRKHGKPYFTHDTVDFSKYNHLDSIQLFALVNDTVAVAELSNYYENHGQIVRLPYLHHFMALTGQDVDGDYKAAAILWNNINRRRSFAGSGLRMLQLGAESGNIHCIELLERFYSIEAKAD